MRIIFEGLDGTGKTTCAKYMSEALRLPYYHAVKPTDINDIYTEMFLDNIVMDRCSFVDSIVYNNGIYNIKMLKHDLKIHKKLFRHTIFIYLNNYPFAPDEHVMLDEKGIKDRYKKVFDELKKKHSLIININLKNIDDMKNSLNAINLIFS
ncbi:hypothetical protein [Mycobacterium sp.]|uniref:hypothetical protein n=1 Tax=Mycobacterium sp. TaxID=1785 RepID=UPI0031E37F33